MSKLSVSAAAFLGAAALLAPALAGEDAPKTNGKDPRVGEKVDRICFQRSIDGWREAKGFKNSVLLERGLNNWYLVKVSGPCNSRDFAFAEVIGIDSRPAGGCVRRGDAIIVESAGRFKNRCFIRSIRKWDHKAPAPEAAAGDTSP